MTSSGRPSVFRAATFDEAMQQAQAADSWLIVDATAVWCGPCKTMDQRTWPDADVAEWLESHGIAIQIDVDEHQALAHKLEVRAMPTVIAFKAGHEKDRVVGFRNPQALLAGSTRSSAARPIWTRRAARWPIRNATWKGGWTSPTGCCTGASSTKRQPTTCGCGTTSPRSSRGCPACACRSWRPASSGWSPRTRPRARASARSAIAPAPPPTPIRRSAWPRFDWVVLNEILGEQAATLAWFDADQGRRRRGAGHREGRAAADPAADAAQAVGRHRARLRRPGGRAAARARADERPRPRLGRPRGDVPGERDDGGSLSRERRAAVPLRCAPPAAVDEARAIEREASRLDPSDEMRTALRTAVEN